jgi:hypothetical protein
VTVHNRRLKLITFTLGGVSFECQVKTWKLDPGEEDGERMYTYCADGEFEEETDPDPTLELSFFSDWRSGGISRYLTENGGQTVAFQIDHHPDIVGEHVRWTGQVRLKKPAVGGDARATEVTDITLKCIGEPEFTAVG